MTPGDWVSILASIGAFGLAGANMLKGKAEARKLDRDGHAQLADSGVRVVESRNAEIDKLKEDVNGLIRRERARDRLAVQHERWDLDVVAKLERLGETVSVPPPLFVESDVSKGGAQA